MSILFLYVFLFSIIAGFASGSEDMSGGTVVLIYILAVVLGVITSYAWAFLSYRNYGYEVSEDAFHSEQGVIRKKYISIPYERIQNIDIHRGILGRLLGLSDLDIQTAGGSRGGFSREGRLPGLDKDVAIKLRDQLIKLAKSAKSGV